MEPPKNDIPDRTNPNLLTPEEAAAHARVSRSMIYAWCDERRLAHIRAGGRGRRGKVLIHRKDLDAFLLTLRVEATNLPPR